MKMQRSNKKKTHRKVLRFGINVLTISFKPRLTNPHTYRHSGRAVRIQNCEQQTKNRKFIWNSNNNRLNGNIFCSLLFESQRTRIFKYILVSSNSTFAFTAYRHEHFILFHFILHAKMQLKAANKIIKRLTVVDLFWVALNARWTQDVPYMQYGIRNNGCVLWNSNLSQDRCDYVDRNTKSWQRFEMGQEIGRKKITLQMPKQWILF